MSELAIYILIYLASVLVASISQIILKKSAGIQYKSRIYEYLNIRVILAYGMFFISTLLTMYALKVVPLSLSTLLEGSGYIYIFVMGYFFLNEKMTTKKWIGSAFIIAGILVYTLFP